LITLRRIAVIGRLFVLHRYRVYASLATMSTKRQIELHGYCNDIGLDGFPTDPNHPFNKAG
jgi:hypothetical protein